LSGNFVVLIPAYNPDTKLLTLVEALLEQDCRVVVVDDGSLDTSREIFDTLKSMKEVDLLAHAVNLGKGAALKTGLNHIAVHEPRLDGVVCADADGQHSVKDILLMGKTLAENPGSLGLGVRTFHREIPFRSRFGNILTKHLLRFLTGLNIQDTQTGLRAVPMSFIPQCLHIRSNRYELELEMLLLTKQHHVPIVQVPIDTIYIDDNQSSHFNVLKDSAKIYFVLFRFVFSSLLAALLDYAIFMAVFVMTANVLASQYVARTLSGLFNFTVNRKLVFPSKSNLYTTLAKYVLLAIVLAYCSFLLITYFVWLGMPVALAKPLAEGCLFLVSFSIQRSLVFSTLLSSSAMDDVD
jgi:glycosyltransferase involved in cell wall biosynthesis